MNNRGAGMGKDDFLYPGLTVSCCEQGAVLNPDRSLCAVFLHCTRLPEVLHRMRNPARLASAWIPIVACMNYREHLHVPSAVRIEVSVADHPEYDRVIEVPEHSPEEWLTEAYLLSIGVDTPEAHPDAYRDDAEGFAREHRDSDAYWGGRWVVKGAVDDFVRRWAGAVRRGR